MKRTSKVSLLVVGLLLVITFMVIAPGQYLLAPPQLMNFTWKHVIGYAGLIMIAGHLIAGYLQKGHQQEMERRRAFRKAQQQRRKSQEERNVLQIRLYEESLRAKAS